MKLLASFFILILLFSSAGAFQTTLAGYWHHGWNNMGGEDTKEEIIQRQIIPIDEAFGFGTDMDAMRSRQFNLVTIDMSQAYNPQGRSAYPDYSIIRNGQEVNTRTDNVMAGDIIRFEADTLDIGNDWINPGGSVADPPVQVLDTQEYNELKQSLSNGFDERYPCASITKCDFGNYSISFPQGVPEFKTDSWNVSLGANYYEASNGNKAFLIPGFNGNRLGVQFICSRIQPTITGNAEVDCRATETGTDCKVLKVKGAFSIASSISSDCLMHVDSVIKGQTAVGAGWIMTSDTSVTGSWTPTLDSSIFGSFNFSFQSVPEGMKAPVARISCKKIENPHQYNINYNIVECDASSSTDADGTIETYQWWTGNYPWWTGNISKTTNEKTQVNTNITQTITLRVTDNDGLYGEVTKTIDPNNLEEIDLIASFNSDTRMAEIETVCEQENVEINIVNAVSGMSLIEAVDIPCNELSEIGPITEEGSYEVVAEFESGELSAVFATEEAE